MLFGFLIWLCCFFYGKEDCFACQWFILEWLIPTNDHSRKQLKYEDKKWCWFDYGWSIAFISIYLFYDLEILLYIERFTDQNEKRMSEKNKNQSKNQENGAAKKPKKPRFIPSVSRDSPSIENHSFSTTILHFCLSHKIVIFHYSNRKSAFNQE